MTSSSSRGRKRPGEFELIAKLFAPLATAKGAFGLSDDVAILTPKRGYEIVLKTDEIVEGVHFFPGDPPATVAQKALRVNISDLASKGAEPAGYLMALSLSSSIGMNWLEGFARGLAQDQREFGISLLGGDTTSTPGPVTISITALGWVRAGTMTRRRGARRGDLVFVSGTIGDAGAGLALLKSAKSRGADAKKLIARYRTPEPRLALGRKLAGLASASIDVSDGLLADLGHVAEVSNVRVEVDAPRVPLSAPLRRIWGSSEGAVLRAATAGDDYEIAFTCRPENASRVRAAARAARTKVTEIGKVVRGRGVALLDGSGRPLRIGRLGFTHF